MEKHDNSIRMLLCGVRKKRENLERKQKRFANAANINPKQYSRMEYSATDIQMTTFVRICVHLGVTPWELMKETWGDCWPQIEKEIREMDARK